MKVIKEPIDVDFSKKSEPWTEDELVDFRELMRIIRAKNATRKKGRFDEKINPKDLSSFQSR